MFSLSLPNPGESLHAPRPTPPHAHTPPTRPTRPTRPTPHTSRMSAWDGQAQLEFSLLIAAQPPRPTPEQVRAATGIVPARSIIVEFIQDLATRYSAIRVGEDTVSLAVAYFDTYIMNAPNTALSSFTVAQTCFRLACKFLERRFPQCYHVEMDVLTVIGWQLHLATPWQFVTMLCCAYDSFVHSTFKSRAARFHSRACRLVCYGTVEPVAVAAAIMMITWQAEFADDLARITNAIGREHPSLSSSLSPSPTPGVEIVSTVAHELCWLAAPDAFHDVMGCYYALYDSHADDRASSRASASEELA